ncbi:MAG: glycosyltransferase family 2 protein, partial [Deltaproteobacteria bacterium]|nr:glycosyltransferase family 2 protein [Deltaproteobacteria bacterium]
MSPDPPRLTLCVVARDEEQALPGCLASVAGLADQLVVVDTGSVDRTIAVARELGAEVHQHTWADDFALHRNQALGYAQGEWVLVLDADERLAPQGREELPALLHAPDAADVLYLPVESTISGGAMVVSLPRLFRRRLEAEYRYPVHEQLVFPPAARVGFAALRIIHSGYASPEQNRAKALRNLALLQRMAAGEEHRLRFEVRTLGTLRRWEELRQLFARYRSLHPAPAADACSLAILADLLLEQEEEGWQLLQLARQLHPRSLDVAHAG